MSAVSGATMGFGGLLVILVAGALEYALATIFLGCLRKDNDPKFEDLLLGFKDNNFARTLEAYIRMVVFTFLWSLLFIIPGIVKGIAYSQMFYLMADDKKLTAGEAQKKSMDLMNGHKMDYFVLQLSFLPWILLVGITFGLAFIYVGPYMELTLAAFYDKIKGGSKHGKAQEAELA
jgi:uncharacterized membrane protein